MKKHLIFAYLAVAFAPGLALAERPLAKDEVVAVFTDKTFDGVYLPNNSRFTAYGALDGTLLVVRNGKTEGGRTWFVNDQGQRCATDPAWKNKAEWKDGRCFDVVDAGNGTYHQFENGQHMHTLNNLRGGNQL